MKTLETVQGILIKSFLLLLPIFFLPITADFFAFNKLVLLVIFVLVSLIIWAAVNLKEFKFFSTPLDLPLVLLGIAFVIASFLAEYSFLDAFVKPGNTTIFLSAIATFFIITQYVASAEDESASRRNSVLSFFLAGVFLASLTSLLAGTGMLAALVNSLNGPAWLTVGNFTPTGSTLSSILLFIIAAPLFFGKVWQAYKDNTAEEKIIKTASVLVVFIVFLMGTLLTIYLAMPGKIGNFRTLPTQAGWSIMLETLKEKPIFGISPGNFVEAFSRYKPVQYNLSDVWNNRFAESSNFYFNIITTTGFVGLACLTLLLWRVKKILVSKKAKEIYLKSAISFTLIVLLFAPANLVILVSLLTLLSLLVAPHAEKVAIQFITRQQYKVSNMNIVSGGVGLVAVLALAGTLFFGQKAYAAEVYYRNALNVIAKQGTYKDMMDNLARAVEANPQEDAYRISYSQISLALVGDIIKKPELTDEDRSDISQLVQFAIQQARSAIALNQTRSENWVNLAQVYQAVMPIAEGADQWAIASYSQAIALDPVNPVLRVSLAGVYYSLGNYEAAINSAGFAVNAKADYANAYYNLALAQRETGKIQEAAQSMATVLSLIPAGSKDYELAKTTLDELQAQLKEEEQVAAPEDVPQETTLETPQPATLELNPPIELPADSAPPTPESEE